MNDDRSAGVEAISPVRHILKLEYSKNGGSRTLTRLGKEAESDVLTIRDVERGRVLVENIL